jgi:hypothetical protein
VDVGSARDLPARGGRPRGEVVTFRSAAVNGFRFTVARAAAAASGELDVEHTDTYPCYRFGKVALILFNWNKTEHAAHAMLVVGLHVAWRPRERDEACSSFG